MFWVWVNNCKVNNKVVRTMPIGTVQMPLLLSLYRYLPTQQTFTCLNSTIEKLEKEAKYVQS